MLNRNYSERLARAARKNLKERDFWLNQLAGEPVKSRFPYDHAGPGGDKYDAGGPGMLKTRLPGKLAARLNGVANRSDHTLHIILLAGLVLLLEKYTGSRDIIVATPIYKQGIEKEFINTVLAIRNKPDPGLTFKQLLSRVKQAVIRAVENQNYPLELLLEQLEMPSLDTALLVENIHSKKYLRHMMFNMIFSFSRAGDGVDGSIEYNSMLYNQTAVERIMGHFVHLLQGALINPDREISRIELLPEAERNRLLYEFNETAFEYPGEKTLSRLFEEQVRSTPDRIALVLEDHRLTYRELNKCANQVAGILRAKGAAADGIIGLMVDISLEMIIGMIAVLKAGGAFLPLEPDYSPDRLTYMAADSDVEILLTGSSLKDRFPFGGEIVQIDRILLSAGGSPNPGEVNTANNLAYVIYTSGSTGKPKGVMIQHNSIVNQIWGFKEMFYRGCILNHLLLAPFTFDPSVQHVFSPVTYGGALFLAPKTTKNSPLELLDFIVSRQVGIIDAVPSQLSVLLEFVEADRRLSVKYIILAGEVFSGELYRRIKERLKVEKVVNVYGPTEATINATLYDCGRLTADDRIRISIPIGKPLMNYRVYILDQGLKLVPTGLAGEICISGVGLARGYLNRPQLTGAAFVENPYIQGGIIYRTGDLGRWLPDGNIEFSGRADNQIKIRGSRVELGEIESRLLTYEGIKEAAVIDRDDETGDKKLYAYIISDRAFNAAQLRKYLAKHLPGYMIPSYFTRLEEIPLTANGKLDRKALPLPGGEAVQEYAAPRDEIERKMVAIWSGVLGLDSGAIGINANFFDLGGHSLKAAVVISKIHKELKVKIPLAEVFRTPTVMELSVYTRAAVKDQYVAVNPVEKKDYYVLSPAQKRLYILQQLDTAKAVYNMPHVIPLAEGFQEEKTAKIFAKLIARHESLRTSFTLVEGKPVQRIHDGVPFKIEFHEEKSKDAIVNSFVRPFDLSQAPLLRVGLGKTAAKKHILLLDTHHIITDGTSQDILTGEFAQLAAGEKLPPLRLQYKDYSGWLNRKEQQNVMKRQETYWCDLFSDEPPVLNLPTDYPRPMVQSFEGASVDFLLNETEARNLKRIAAENNATLYMVVLAIYTLLLSKLGGQEDIIVGAPVASRRHVDLGRIIGMFVNTLAMRNFPCGDKTFKEFLTGVKERTIKAFENQEYQFEDLVDKISARRDTGRNPVFDVMFNLLNQSDYREDIPAKKEQNSLEHKTGVSRFDMILAVIDAGGQLYCNFEYCTALFTPRTIERFIGYFKKISWELPGSSQKRLAHIEIIPAEEKRRVLVEFNDTKTGYPGDCTIAEVFQDQVEKRADYLAVVFKDRAVTYGELAEKSDRLAGLLRQKGVAGDVIVGLMTEPSIEMALGMLGILKSGGAYLPLTPGDPGTRINYMLTDSAADILLTSSAFASGYPTGYRLIDLDDPALYSGPGGCPGRVNSAGSPAYIMYTSGSTGSPKGVMVVHRNVIRLVSTPNYVELTADTRILQTGPPVFDASTFEIWGTLLNGGILYEVEKEVILDAGQLGRTLTANKITTLWLSSPLFNQLMQQKSDIFGKLRYLLVGGDVLSPRYINMARNNNKGLKIINGYGPTENTTFSACYLIDKDIEANIPIGKPIGNSFVYILDRDNRPQPVGIFGQLWVGGDGVSRGYLNNPDLTAERFQRNRSYFSKRLYNTGDIARWLPDGNIEFSGRIDHQIKLRGFRVELEEIESQLLKHRDIEEAVVRIIKGEHKYLCAYIVSSRGLSTALLREHLAQCLPDFMIPAYFIRLDRIPLNASGKVARGSLPEPGGGRPGLAATYVAPRTDKEKTIAATWKEVLNLDKVGLNDNFFDLGGNSLTVIQVKNKLKEALGQDIPVVTLFQFPTIGSLAGNLYPGKAKEEEHKENRLKEAGDLMTETVQLFGELENE